MSYLENQIDENIDLISIISADDVSRTASSSIKLYNESIVNSEPLNSLNIYKISPDLTVQIVLALITLMAVIVALFQEKIKDWWNKSRLEPEINLEPPDCHQIDLSDPDSRQVVGKAMYIRIRVKHSGGNSAKNVEAIISKVEIFENESWNIVKSFLPMNLKWSHYHVQKVGIPEQSFRHCDLGSFRQMEGIGNIVTVFLVDTIVQPNSVADGYPPNLLKPGKYRLQILFTGENVKPILKKWIIDFNASWYNDETRMLEIITIDDVSDIESE